MVNGYVRGDRRHSFTRVVAQDLPLDWSSNCTLLKKECEQTSRGERMPERKTTRRARKDARQGKAASTQAGEYVHEEIEHVREGKHGARSAKQAIAIGLSKARRAGVKVKSPQRGSSATRKKAAQDSARGRKRTTKKTSARRSRATSRALKREGHSATSTRSLSRQAHSSARRRTAGQRSAAAKRAGRTKGSAGRSAAAKKAARTRSRRG